MNLNPKYYTCPKNHCKRVYKNGKSKKFINYWTGGIVPYRNALINGFYAKIKYMTFGIINQRIVEVKNFEVMLMSKMKNGYGL